VAVAALVIGSVLGSMYGERWHSRLLARAADPERGRSAQARRRADELEAERDRLVQADVRPVAAHTDDTEREQIAREDLERQRDVQQPIDLRDGDARQTPVADEPRYTAAEWEAMRRAESSQSERF
jgi:hypothetical protein